MSIRIIEEPELVLTRADYDRLYQEYRQVVMHMVNPPSFESWARSQTRNAEYGGLERAGSIMKAAGQ